MLHKRGWGGRDGRRASRRPGAHTTGQRPAVHSVVEAMERRLLLHAGSPEFYVLPAEFLFEPGGTLTAPAKGKAVDLALKYLTSRARDLGLTKLDVSSAVVTDQYTDPDVGVTHVYFKQQVNGLTVDNTSINVNLTRDGQILSVGGAFVRKVQKKAESLNGRRTIIGRRSLQALANLGLGVPAEGTFRGTRDQGDYAFHLPQVSLDLIKPKLVYVATRKGIQPAWKMQVRTPDREHWYDTHVDAFSGDLLYANDWVSHATYNVYPAPIESPIDDPGGTASRVITTDPHDPVASPFGWHDTNGIIGAEYTDTRGNNVFAQEDIDGNNTGGARPDGGVNLSFDFPLDLAQAPGTYREAATRVVVRAHIPPDNGPQCTVWSRRWNADSCCTPGLRSFTCSRPNSCSSLAARSPPRRRGKPLTLRSNTSPRAPEISA